MNLKHFIKSLKTLTDSSRTTTYVLGNSSVDYDSFFGSILYAFFLTNIYHTIYIPLIDCKIEDIPLRFEISYILQKHGIDFKDLTYFGNHQKNSQYILYDHNNRENIKILQIIDHHDYKNLPTNNHLIYPTGSALTLLYYLYNPNLLSVVNNNHLKSPNLLELILKFRGTLQRPFQKYDPLVDELIRYGILMDCFNFDPNQKDRWTEYDLVANRKIEKQNQFQIGYKQLNAIKFNQKMSLKLTCIDHLRKDSKQFLYSVKNQDPLVKYLAYYSVILLNPSLFIKVYGQELQSNIIKHKLATFQTDTQKYNIKGDCFFLMFIYEQQGKMKRDVMFQSLNSQYISEIKNIFTNIKMIEVDSDAQNWLKFTDPSGTISRKLVDKYMRSSL